MLKRVMLALAVTVVATIAFWFLFAWATTGRAVFGYDWDRFLASAFLVLCGVFLAWQRFRWPEMMFLGFALALCLGCSVEVLIGFAVVHREAWPWLTSQVLYLDTINPSLWQPAQVLRGIGLCFPIPLFALVWNRLTS